MLQVHEMKGEQQRDVIVALFLEKIILELLLFWKNATFGRVQHGKR